MFWCQRDTLKVTFERGSSDHLVRGGEGELRGRDGGRAVELKYESEKPQQWFRERS